MESVNLRYTTFGDKHQPPLLILHGLFGSGRNWQSIARQLSTHWYVYLPDLRNHGDSPHSAQMDFPHMALDIQHFIQHHQIKGCHIIAHSMGGKTACWLALEHPELLSSLIIVDIAPMPYAHNFDDILNALDALELTKINSRKQANDQLAQHLSLLSLRQFLLQNLHLDNNVAHWRIDLNIIRQSIPTIISFPDTTHIKPCTIKTLFIAGAQSDYLQAHALPHIQRLFPQHQYRIIQQAGHWVHAEQPKAFIQQIEQFLP